jgi:hypothetical protein
LSQLIPDFTVFSAFVFSGHAREHTLVVPGDNLSYVRKLELVLYGMPELDSDKGAHDVRVLVNGRDITPFILGKLIEQLDALAAPDFQSRYSSAMLRWLDYRAAAGVLPEWLKSQQTQAHVLAERKPLDLFPRMGDKHSGDNGHLDAFNFLYRDIELSAVDIYPTLEPADLSRTLKFTVSSGPSRSSSVPWSPKVSHGHGAVHFFARALFADPIEDMLKSLQANISQRLNDISLQTGSTGNIARTLLPAIKDRLTELDTDLNKCGAALAGQAQQLASLENSVKDLKAAVKGL